MAGPIFADDAFREMKRDRERNHDPVWEFIGIEAADPPRAVWACRECRDYVRTRDDDGPPPTFPGDHESECSHWIGPKQWT